MVTRIPEKISGIPGGLLAPAHDVLQALGEKGLRERWLRTRPSKTIELIENPSSEHLFPSGEFFTGIGQALEGFMAQQDELQRSSARVVEFQWESGQTRSGTVGYDGFADPPTRTGLRGRAKHEINLPEGVLTNHVAAYLGLPVNCELGWSTSAPVTGKTLNWNGKSVRSLSWSGHAQSYQASVTSALLEGLERRAGALQSKPEGVTTQAVSLQGTVLTPDDFPAYPDAYYGRIGSRFDEHEPHEWARVSRLGSSDEAWIPREHIYYGEQMAHRLWTLSTSSGCATGSTVAEAQLFGLLELIERDSYVGAWYAAIEPTRLKVDTMPELREILDRAALLGVQLEAGLLPSSIGIPVVVSAARMTTQDGPVIAVGAACAPNIREAIAGSIEEVWTYIFDRVRTVDDKKTRIDQLQADPLLCDTIEDHPLLCIYPQEEAYLYPAGRGPEEPIPEFSQWSTYTQSSPEVLLDVLVEKLASEGVSVWYHIQTSDVGRQCGLETVMTVSPELIPIDFGWLQQRALQSTRLAQLQKEYHGHDAEPRLLPHPFS